MTSVRAAMRFPEVEEIIKFRLPFETEEEYQERLKVAEADRLRKELEFLQMEKVAKEKRRERTKKIAEAQMTKNYENVMKEIDSTYKEDEPMLAQKKYRKLPRMGFFGECERIQPTKIKRIS
ncbi:hypothetical protein C5167_019592 [Papaver somniferum]|uniref:Uncharacterized protein n=1 Tax=Papaver somniferum TaxID=3469 RepID=A0A4Y7ITW1_PAPSO|nr:uncharacterized protein LOC113349046 [Papaver somniferum]RZC51171.1 hypothetical protein C5167_019592 [Papaver somniferum]